MGKRIPKSRRHKKLKFVDPNYKGPRPRTKKKYLQFNEPPVNDDVQEAPHGMEEFINLKNKVKEGKVKRRKKKKQLYKNDFIVVKNKILDKNEPEEKAVKILKQNKTENEQQFINRLQRMADKALAEAKVEEKYNIKLVNVDNDGNAVYKSLDEGNSETNKKQKRKKYREKLQEKKKLKIDDEEFEFKKEHIPFGDVVMAPPTLSSKPKTLLSKYIKEKGEDLKKTLSGNEMQTSLITKWKDMSADRRKELENERSRAVQMYRLLKSKKT